MEIGVRELRERASEVIRKVRERRREVQVTYRGRVVARLIPVARQRRGGRTADVWTDLEHLAQEIGRRWPAGVGAADAVGEQRRNL